MMSINRPGKPSSDHNDEVLDWSALADKALLKQNPSDARLLLYVLISIVVILLCWAGFAKVDEVTRSQGKVIPSRKVQVIQSYDGGVVVDIFVEEGQRVDKDQLLVKLDATRSVSSLREKEAEFWALKAKSERLRAISEGVAFVPSEEIKQYAVDIVEIEEAVYRTVYEQFSAEKEIAEQQYVQRQQELNEVISRKEEAAKSYALARRELTVTKPLVAKGAVSEVELLRLEREVSSLRGERDQSEAKRKGMISAVQEAQSKRDEVELKFKNQIREELSLTVARLNALKETQVGLSDRVSMTDIRSPVNGTIKSLHYNTIGGVVSPGKAVVEIVPSDDTLLLEARVRPRDIAFLSPGQDAVVKFTAYDFIIYGGLDAKVEYIGADTVMDDNGNPFYLIKVRTENSSLGEDKPIIPGMVAEVDILTGKKSILSYMMKPISRAQQYALTER